MLLAMPLLVVVLCLAAHWKLGPQSFVNTLFLWCVLGGFMAQLIDGALGMGYGLVSATFLMSQPIPLAAISASIHSSEIFTTAAGGLAHWQFGNINRSLFRKLVIPGVLGAIAGALMLSLAGDNYAGYLRPILAVYILFLSVKYLLMFFRKVFINREVKHIRALAAVGGFLDSFGGGGWGPLVTVTLMRSSHDPKQIIGSVSLTEFFVTFSSAFTFFLLLGIQHWQLVLGLMAGGVMAAPFSALLAGTLSKRWSYFWIGLIGGLWSLRILSSMI